MGSVIKKLAHEVGAKRSLLGQYTVDCAQTDSLPEVVFTIDGTDYNLSSKEYVIESGGMCLFVFMALDIPSGPAWILGDVFMRKYYTVFDVAEQKVAFATAVWGLIKLKDIFIGTMSVVIMALCEIMGMGSVVCLW